MFAFDNTRTTEKCRLLVIEITTTKCWLTFIDGNTRPTTKFPNQFAGPATLTAAEIVCCEKSSATINHGIAPVKNDNINTNIISTNLS